MLLTVLTPVFACGCTFIVHVYLEEGNRLSSADTFTVLLFFNVLRFPINYAGKLLGKVAQGLEACSRLGRFFARDVNDIRLIDSDDDDKDDTEDGKGYNNDGDVEEGGTLVISNGLFTVGGDSSINDNNSKTASDDDAESNVSQEYNINTFTLSNINLKVKKSQVLAVVGPVGSGKSTLLKALIGDISHHSSTTIKLKGNVSYASQSPFILNATLRENILFGLPYNEALYKQVVKACKLDVDFRQLGPAEDLTEIGERGVTLSGGQKARVSLARCVYSKPSVALFDDVLSALDAETGKWVFENLFEAKGEGHLLEDAATILVTHASHFLSRVDRVLVLVKGNGVFEGSWDELNGYVSEDVVTNEVINSITSSLQEDKETLTEKEDIDSNLQITETKEDNENVDPKTIMTVEERDFGLSDSKTWIKWIKNAGGYKFITITILALFLDRFFYVMNEWWLAVWTAAEFEPTTRFGIEFSPQSEGISAQTQFVKYYSIILAISFFGTLMRSQWIIQGGARCSERLFYSMISRVVYAPMSYFETTPIGRILNRVTYDVEILDITLSTAMTVLMTSSGWFMTGVILMVVILPWILVVLVPTVICYWLLLKHFRKSAIDLQRLDAISRSPIQAKLAEGIDGASVIRTFNRTNHFETLFKSSLDNNVSSMMNFMASQRWLGARFQVLGSFVVLFAVLFVVCFNDRLDMDTGIVAMLIIWSSNFTITLAFFSQAVSESEAYITSVERICTMTELPQERDVSTAKGRSLEYSWPEEGVLTFEDVCMRYRPGLPLALNGLSFSAKAGQRVGICGRTGAGKSTIAVALFRLAEIESGRIVLDGHDLATLGLADIRGRQNGLCIIPQDPVLFSGSLRECLDPWGASTDKEILEALEAVKVTDSEERGLATLDDFVEEGGRNFSVGERQLLCLARAILANPKVLVLDEATASVDGDTDIFIQRMIRERFQGTTLLTIAHRLNTIMDYDVVLVMDAGNVGEIGTPRELLQKQDGLFTALVESTGKESAVALRKLVLSGPNQ